MAGKSRKKKGHDYIAKYRVPFSGRFNLDKHDPSDKPDITREEAVEILAKEQARLKELQNVLWAESKHSVLIVLQAMDTGGKDGTIRKVLGPLNPQGVRVHSFKAPNEKERSHDFLWRIHDCTPKTGMIHVFNRSHYEDVLIARVRQLAPKKVIEQRYRHINNFEELLADSGTTIIKFYLNISKEEQKERLEDRLNVPEKNWKFSSADVKERKLWEDYRKAYEIALSKSSRAYAPWYIIPANRKWYRNIVVARILRQTLEGLKSKYPEPEEGLEQIVIDD
ncbi:MAG: polyphosphate kinase 2 family protein [Planctomycetes bacterium]|nr:polyphosphate kinase 2 family protein [Planctomycetota bacterium]